MAGWEITLGDDRFFCYLALLASLGGYCINNLIMKIFKYLLIFLTNLPSADLKAAEVATSHVSSAGPVESPLCEVIRVNWGRPAGAQERDEAALLVATKSHYNYNDATLCHMKLF